MRTVPIAEDIFFEEEYACFLYMFLEDIDGVAVKTPNKKKEKIIHASQSLLTGGVESTIQKKNVLTYRFSLLD